MRRLSALLAALVLLLPLAREAKAHFQMIYTPDIALEKGGTVDLRLVFTHPFEAGHTMDMGRPESFFAMHQRGEEAQPEKIDLLKTLEPITWTSLTNSGQAYAAKAKVRSAGDYVFVLTPAPFFEPEEKIYLQQITKMILNVAGVPGNWDKPVGLPAEIVPLDKPYALWAGGVFRGQVLSEGKPVPDAAIEVEYLNHAPLLEGNGFDKTPKIKSVPQDAFKTLTIKADGNGVFVFGLPKAGWWGFNALGVGPVKERDGKELSQDAVIWVKAAPMK